MTTRLPTLVALLTLSACAGGKVDSGDPATATTGEGEGEEESELGDGYDFPSAFGSGSSVAYSGQVIRQVLIDDMKLWMGGMTDRLNGGWYPVAGEARDELAFYFDFDSSVGGSIEILTAPEPGPLQLTYDDISSNKNLSEKIAGNDPTGQHRDWSTELVGWNQEGVTSPESLVRAWFDAVDAQAVGWNGGAHEYRDPAGERIEAVYVSPEGLDYRQLLQKFIRGAVAFSQGADDYLDDDTDGKGLLSDHTGPDDGDPYTALEHQWDEGFGYFGAARTYADWSDADIADAPGRDVDGDGSVDLTREMNWGHSVNAAKRDLGAVAATDFTAEAWQGFYAGRQLLSDTAGTALSAEQFAELQGHRDVALEAWEKAIAASVVHYINDTLRDMKAFDSDDYDFYDHAKHWSEMKGFALSLQFNRRSPLMDADNANDTTFARVMDRMGTAPVLPSASQADREAYMAALIEARTLIGDAYGFDAANLGDADGENGW